ncbi:uncharacterized protein LOC106878872 [Argonauta hians]
MANSIDKDRECVSINWKPEWSTDSLTLKEFSEKYSIPNFVKVTKGQYMNIGQSRFALQKSHQQLFIHSIQSCIKVLSHSVQRVSENRPTGPYKQRIYSKKLISLQQRLAIPISYDGWFKILSEDGRGSRSIESVQELAKVFPDKCLVRQDIVAYGTNDEGQLSNNVTKVVQAGEQLLLSGDITTSFPPRNGIVKLLRCVNSQGENVYLSFEKRGLFSPIYSDDMFSGVLQIRDIIRKYRMPLTVKLVHGVWPKVEKERFSGLIRLDWVFVDETVFVCPFEKDIIRMIPVPLDAPLHISPSTNFKLLAEKELYQKIHSKCSRMLSNYNNTIHLIVNVPSAVAESFNKKLSRNIFSQAINPTPKLKKLSKEKERLLMDEIDDIYVFVRDGGIVPKSKFSYNSDEESYWEEPAYETLDDFQQCLKDIESGKQAKYHEKYQPADTTKLGLGIRLNTSCNISNNIRNSQKSNIYSSKKTTIFSKAFRDPKEHIEKSNDNGHFPLRRLQTDHAMNQRNLTPSNGNICDLPLELSYKDSGMIIKSDNPPPVPPRRYKRSGSVPLLDTAPILQLIQSSSEDQLKLSSKSNSNSHGSSATSSPNSSKNFSKKNPQEEYEYLKRYLSKRRQTMFL